MSFQGTRGSGTKSERTKSQSATRGPLLSNSADEVSHGPCAETASSHAEVFVFVPVQVLGGADFSPDQGAGGSTGLVEGNTVLHETPRLVNYLCTRFDPQWLGTAWDAVLSDLHICGRLPSPVPVYHHSLPGVDDVVVNHAVQVELVALR